MKSPEPPTSTASRTSPSLVVSLYERTAPWRRNPVSAYGVAVGLTLVGFVARLLIGDTLVGFPFITFFPAVILAAFLGGLRAGATAAVLSGMLSWYFFLPPYGSFALDWPTGPLAVLLYVFVVTVELGLFKLMTEALARLEAERERSAALLARQETLFEELQHRVANNLQFVASLLSIQKRRVQADPASGAAALEDARSRIDVMARVHRRLYAAEALDGAVGPYLQALCDDIVSASDKTCVICRVRRAELGLGHSIGLKRLVTLSLILNEVVTNSLKHAFNDGAGGEGRVEVDLARAPAPADAPRDEDGALRHAAWAELAVEDDGPGLPPGFEPGNPRKGGLGSKILASLVGQIGGHLRFGPGLDGRGTRVSVRFPLSPPEDEAEGGPAASPPRPAPAPALAVGRPAPA